jgi:hypothetical protein
LLHAIKVRQAIGNSNIISQSHETFSLSPF